MKVKKYKNGTISLTAQNKRDSLNLLKFLHAAAGEKDGEIKDLIEKKEKELDTDGET